MTLLQVIEAIDQLHSEARSMPAVEKYLELAGWHAEEEYRQETGLCSTGHAIDRNRIHSIVGRPTCQCCRYFQSLTTRAKLSMVA